MACSYGTLKITPRVNLKKKFSKVSLKIKKKINALH